jgi:uncharacterized repeat protein (TIGR03803 family)
MKTLWISYKKPVLARLVRLICCAVFLAALASRASVVLTTLYSFGTSTNGDDGSYPISGLVEGNDGNFYGMTDGGGSPSFGEPGTVFQISAKGVLTTLYSFGGNDGGLQSIFPLGGLARGSDGYFYGTTSDGGAPDPVFASGSVFRISTNGDFSTLYSFTGTHDGLGLDAGLLQGTDGYFYGTTSYGGTNGYGTVFKISTNGALTSLYSFTGGNDGAEPEAALVQGSDGYIYGTTLLGGARGSYEGYGTVFKVSTNGALTSLYSFTGSVDGAEPQAALMQGTDGYLYGTTPGSVFKISTNGVLTTLSSFGGNYRAGGAAGLVLASDGYFYGTADDAGPYTNQDGQCGAIFKISTNGVLTSLYSFTCGPDGSQPSTGMVQGGDGSFYGTTHSGGQGGAGTVFRLTIVPEIQAVTLKNSTLSLTWSTEAGGKYQLQYNSDLSSTNWASLGNAVIATGSTLDITDSVTNGPQRFYRLALSP